MRLRRDWRQLPWELRHRRWPQYASRLRRLTIEATHLHCHVEFQGPVYIGPGFHLDIPHRDASFVVGPGVEFRRDFGCEIVGSGCVVIREGTSFTYQTQIQCSTAIDIGRRCGIGRAVIADGIHRFRDLDAPSLHQGFEFRHITIGDDVLIHSNCTVVNSIGDHSIIGANAVVTRPIPAYCLAIGVPARVVEYFGPPEGRPPDLEI
jgi:acetyltransferase-like isoleucine patch superfamily enzyme